MDIHQKHDNDFKFFNPHLLIILSAFAVLRLSNIRNFPIFNDEAIYIQYSQLMHYDWEQFKFISVNNYFHDWKPPLPYWILSAFIGNADPLLTSRLVSAAVSFIGLLSIYGLGGYFLASRRAAFLSALFWIFNPTVIFFDRLFLAETYVYSFSAAALLFTYLSVAKSRLYIMPSILFGALTLLSKQTGQLTIVAVFFLSALQVRGKEGGGIYADYQNIASIAITAVSSYVIYRLVIPAEYFADYDKFSSLWTFSLREVSGFPFSYWKANSLLVYRFLINYYSPLIFLAIFFFTTLCISVRDKRHLVVFLWFAFSGTAVILALKGFNEYIFNTSTVIFITMMLAASFDILIGAVENHARGGIRFLLRYAVPLVFIAPWIYQLPYYYASADAYMKKFGTPWMIENDLYGWPGGFGINEIVHLLEKERNRIVFIDPQWGNPGTGIQVFKAHYPALKLRVIDRYRLDILNNMPPGSSIAVFKVYNRGWDEKLLTLNICAEKMVFRVDGKGVPLVYCRN